VDAVSEAEVEAAVASGRVLDCSAGGARRTLDAAVLRRFCLARKAEVDPRGIRVANAAVTGQLDLVGLDVPFPLRLADCELDEPVMAEGAQLFDLVITGTSLPGLLANGVRVRRDLDLSRQVPYNASPYEQAARVFRQHGYGDGARAILIAQRRHARAAGTKRGSPGGRALDAAYGLTVAYGYRPARVLWLILALLVAVTVSLQVPGARAAMRATTSSGAVYTTAGPLGRPAHTRTAPCGDGEVRCFNPVLYAIDTVIPIISLDQRSTWYPDTSTLDGTAMQWWLDIATILGWLLSSVFVLALAGLARSP